MTTNAPQKPEDSRVDARHDSKVVGIGASAGGLEALESLFAALPADTGMAFVVVQHLSPDFKNHMEELLARRTIMPVHRVEHGMAIKPNCVYLMPPKTELLISDGKLLLVKKGGKRTLSHPIDQFFRSLAGDVGRRAVGVVLSGTGSDGSRGIRDIHEAGGLVIAQDEQTAKFDGMPMNAQSTGVVDVVLPPAGIAQALSRYSKEQLTPQTLVGHPFESSANEGVDRVFQLLREQHGLDFSQYKDSTVGRRIQRRIELNHNASLEEYLNRIETDPTELNALYKDLLIGVTKFFRDPEAFAKLESRVIPEMFRRAQLGESLRVWVAGCASGEEAYSIAMLIDEYLRSHHVNPEVKVFATDAHHVSLHAAAKGVFSEEALSEMTDERRARYFQRKRDGYHVTRELRRHIIFAPHNVISDAPFTQIDLVSCRNLLIYLRPSAQKKALSMFHFALIAGGTLFLGPSESPGDLREEFQTLDKRWRIYSKRRNVRIPLEPVRLRGGRLLRAAVSAPAKVGPPQDDQSLLRTYDRLLDRKMPPSILVNEKYEILHVFAGAGRYLRVPAGRPTNSLLDAVEKYLKIPLSGALQLAVRKQDAVQYLGIPAPSGDGNPSVRLTVEPIHVPEEDTVNLLVEIESVDDQADASQEHTSVDISELSKGRIASLESELRYSQENLQATIEEMQTSNEELQAANEELVASNEELQSTNEELHSVNEELFTVNAEHQRRLEELTQANNDMDNLLATTRVGVIFLDDELFIRRFTPEIARLFHLVPHDVGRSIEGFTHHLKYGALIPDLKDVFSLQQEKEVSVEDRQGTPYLLRMLPYHSGEGVQGVVLTLIDVGILRRAQAELERFKYMAESAADMQALVDADGYLQYVNPAMCTALGYSHEDLSQLTVMDIDSIYDRRRFRTVFRQAEAERVPPFESELRRKDGNPLPVEISVSSVVFGEQRFLFAILRDITQRLKSEFQMRLQKLAIDHARNGILITDSTAPDNPITYANPGFCALTGYEQEEIVGRNCRFLQGKDTDPATVRLLREAVHAGKSCRVTVLNYHKDGSTFWNDLRITPVKDDRGRLTNFVGVQNEISEQIEAESSARQFAGRIQAILDTAAEGVYGIDCDGICTFCNRSALNMLGYESESEVVGQHMHRLIHHSKADKSPLPEEECQIYRASRERLATHVNDEVFWCRDGSSFPVEYRSRPKVRKGEVVGAVVTFQDISERLALVGRLEQMGKMIDASHDAIIVWDLSRKIISWNYGATKLYGYSAEEAVGRDTHKLLSTRHPIHWDKIYDSLRETGEWVGVLEHVTQSGQRISVSTRHQLLTMPNDDLQILEINRDITEQKKIQKQLEKAHRLARKASEAKSAFLANMSHELRTPMTAVLGFADMLSLELEDPCMIEKVDTIKRNGEYLLALMDDILDLSKIEAGRMDVESESIEVRATIEDVASLMNVRAHQAGIPLSFEWKTRVPKRVTADRVRVRQILVNLIGNALKFTEEGEVRVTVELNRRPRRPTLDIAVIDTGIGIPMDLQEELFKPFTRASEGTSRRYGGTGLGLSISKRLAEAMNGSIVVKSEPDVGSRFTLSLPVSKQELDRLVTVAVTTKEADAAKSDQAELPSVDARILLADDRRDVSRVVKYFLERAGMDVSVAEDGRQAVEAAESAARDGRPFDLVLMDMQMPVMSGRDAVVQLRRKGLAMPIIALTADAMEGEREACIELGCNEYLPKPVDGGKLVRLVASLLS